MKDQYENYRILIVDDEEIMRQMLLISLQDMGFTAVAADSGEMALDYMNTQSYDLVITDVKMPGLNGLNVFQNIQQNYPNTHVIIITGYSMQNNSKFYLEKGAFGFLLKPFDLDQIRELVLESFHLKSGHS